MDLSISPGIDATFTRARLKQISAWIRDDLDPLVARGGPDSLRLDDVLALHDIFMALRGSPSITALDLRSSGIHNAVKIVSGFATRWPKRLCHECDRVLSAWTAKFGDLDELHPFMHGRGGRLEGIAGPADFTRQLAHRQGSLGFEAGAWWIDPIFAHYAGIIGLESVEGGITFDHRGAYAIVLNNAVEINISSAESIKYRTSVKDRGKFRLTAATPRSREPVRVLRCHNTDSLWGPKAGIRYEGLYIVKGWSIHVAQSDDIGNEWQQGDVLYEIELVRKDFIPLKRVVKHPTQAEMDDYKEYQRLRNIHRRGKHESLIGVKFSPHPVVKEAPKIKPPPLAVITTNISDKPVPRGLQDSPGSSPGFHQSSTEPHSRDSPPRVDEEYNGGISPKALARVKAFTFKLTRDSTTEESLLENPRSSAEEFAQASKTDSVHSSTNTSEMLEITPWMLQEPDIDTPSPPVISQSNRRRVATSPVGESPLPKSVAIDSSSYALTNGVQRTLSKQGRAGIKTTSQQFEEDALKRAATFHTPHLRPKSLLPSSLHLTPATSLRSGKSFPLHGQGCNPMAEISDLKLVPTQSANSTSKQSSYSPGSNAKLSVPRSGPFPPNPYPGSSIKSKNSSAKSKLRPHKFVRSVSYDQTQEYTQFRDGDDGSTELRPTPIRSLSSSHFKQLARLGSRSKTFQGEGDCANDSNDYFANTICRVRRASSYPIRIAPAGQQPSLPNMMRTDSPISSRPVSPAPMDEEAEGGLESARRNPTQFDCNAPMGAKAPHCKRSQSVRTSSDRSSQASGSTRSSSGSLIQFITQARLAAPVGSSTSTSVLWRGTQSETCEQAGAVMFRNPFKGGKDGRGGVVRDSSGGGGDVAPECAE